MSTHELLIRIAGVLHLGILAASALVPGALDWRVQLRHLPPLCRQLIWVHGGFIVLTIILFGVIVLLCAGELSSGSMLARTVCASIALFWSARLGVQFFVFDARDYLTTTWLKAGYHGLTIVFTYLSVVFGWTAVVG